MVVHLLTVVQRVKLLTADSHWVCWQCCFDIVDSYNVLTVVKFVYIVDSKDVLTVMKFTDIVMLKFIMCWREFCF